MTPIIYKTKNCPMCELLIMKLKEHNIEYNIIDDEQVLREKNISFVPVLEVNSQLLNLKEALRWIEGGS